MLPVSHLLAFSVTAFVIIVVPGPSVLFVFGIGALVEQSALVFTALKLAGAAYLLYLGVQAIRRRRSLAATLAAPVERKTVWRITLDGFFVGATNPKTAVFLAAILPQFIDRANGHVPFQIIVLGAIFSCLALICDSAWALAAGTARAWLARSPRRLELLGGTSGLVMIGLGATMALTGRKA
jgi:threonine/homoserine/homoserine lactone efflux protein